MDTDDRGYEQPFNFANSAALSVALDNVYPELQILHRYFSEMDDDETLTDELRQTIANLTIRNALSYIERAASGQLILREQPTLLKYLVNANMILRQQNQVDNPLAEHLLELERSLITGMALSFPHF